MSNKLIYMDHAAATPLSAGVFLAMKPYFEEKFANPTSLYSIARETRKAVDDARAEVANALGAKVSEIIFTAGATEAINMAIQGVARQFPGSHIVATNIEHDAVLATLDALKEEGFSYTLVPVAPDGTVNVEDVLSAVTAKTVLVCVMLANNEIGTVQPVRKISQGLAEIKNGRKLPLYLFTDAAQAPEYLDVHVSRLGVDLMALNGSKIYGPKQSGCLYVRTGTILKPLIYGGGQEKGLRSGTENVAEVIGFAKALALAGSQRDKESKRLEVLRDYAWTEIQKLIPDAILNGEPKRRLPNNLNFTIPGAEGEALVLYLDKAGIATSTGSACSSGDQDPSHVLLAISRSQKEANCSLRLTFGRSTTSSEIDYLLETLPNIVTRVKELS